MSRSVCSAVVQPLVEVSPGRWVADCSRAVPLIVPLLSLGQQMVASAASADGAFSLGATGVAAGGHALRSAHHVP